MNIIATIPQREDERWVKALFSRRKKDRTFGNRVAVCPPVFPFARRIAQQMQGKTLYLVYRKHIIGYARIAKHEEHNEAISVGLTPEDVGPGTKLTLQGPLEPLDPPIPCVGFRNFRYTSKELHKIGIKKAQQELRDLGLDSSD